MIETMEEFESFMNLVYEMNPNLSEEEIDDRIYKGIKKGKEQ